MSLIEVCGKNSVQYRRTTPADFLLFIQMSLSSIEKVQSCIFVSSRHQFCNSLKLMTKVVTLDSNALFHFSYFLQFVFQGGNLHC